MDVNITARPAAVAAAMERAGECYTGDERRVTERRTALAVDPNEDLLEVARTLCAIAERMSTMTAQQLQLYPSATCEGSPVLEAARAAIVKRGYNQDGTAVPGRVYPARTATHVLTLAGPLLEVGDLEGIGKPGICIDIAGTGKYATLFGLTEDQAREAATHYGRPVTITVTGSPE